MYTFGAEPHGSVRRAGPGRVGFGGFVPGDIKPSLNAQILTRSAEQEGWDRTEPPKRTCADRTPPACDHRFRRVAVRTVDAPS